MYYFYSDNSKMSRATIHFGDHIHHVAKGMYKNSMKKFYEFIVELVARILMASNSTIVPYASKEFLTIYLFHNEERDEILKADELGEVMDCF